MSEKTRKPLVEKPVKTIILTVVLWFLVDAVASPFVSYAISGSFTMDAQNTYAVVMVSRIPLIVVMAALLYKLFGRGVFVSRGWSESFRLSIYLLLVGVGYFVYYWFALPGGNDPSSWSLVQLPIVVLMSLFVGIFEEFMYRGVIQGVLVHNAPPTSAGLTKPIVVSMVLFAVVHVFADVAQMTTLAGFLQGMCKIIQTAIFGFFFSVVYLKTQSLWPIAVIHGLYDALNTFLHAATVNQASSDAVVGSYLSVIDPVPYLVLVALSIPLGVIAWRVYKTIDPAKAKAGLPS